MALALLLLPACESHIELSYSGPSKPAGQFAAAQDPSPLPSVAVIENIRSKLSCVVQLNLAAPVAGNVKVRNICRTILAPEQVSFQSDKARLLAIRGHDLLVLNQCQASITAFQTAFELEPGISGKGYLSMRTALARECAAGQIGFEAMEAADALEVQAQEEPGLYDAIPAPAAEVQAAALAGAQALLAGNCREAAAWFQQALEHPVASLPLRRSLEAQQAQAEACSKPLPTPSPEPTSGSVADPSPSPMSPSPNPTTSPSPSPSSRVSSSGSGGSGSTSTPSPTPEPTPTPTPTPEPSPEPTPTPSPTPEPTPEPTPTPSPTPEPTPTPTPEPTPTPTPTPTPEPTPTPPAGDFVNDLGMSFIRVPAGSFMMGQANISGASPVHQVTLSRDFYLQTTEVTQKQWWDVMGTWPFGAPNPAYGIGDQYPIYYISWNDTQNFLAALNARGEGSYRLPTEAEWEYAARAGTTGFYACETDGDSIGCLNSLGWHNGNSDTGQGRRSHPVAQKLPNPWGLYDMHGNLMEWVSDWYATPYSAEPTTDPMGPESGTDRCLRGGSWFFNDQYSRSARRSFGAVPNVHSINIGFRLVREVEANEPEDPPEEEPDDEL